jgi:hypothetical protein
MAVGDRPKRRFAVPRRTGLPAAMPFADPLVDRAPVRPSAALHATSANAGAIRDANATGRTSR